MKKNFLIIGLITILAGSGLAFALKTNAKSESTCTESTEKCCQKRDSKAPGGMLWESLSNQFFTSSGS